jgi:helix-turn-helix protein
VQGKARAAILAGRPPLRSPGRPPVNRSEERRCFWRLIAEGLSSEDAAVSCGVSMPLGPRWFREGGGMPSISLDLPSGRYLSFAEREEIALLRAKGCGVREIARRIGRCASTISRELRRNAATRGGRLDYRASVAQWHADRQARRPKTAKLAANERLQRYVQDRLAGAVTGAHGRVIPGSLTRWTGRTVIPGSVGKTALRNRSGRRSNTSIITVIPFLPRLNSLPQLTIGSLDPILDGVTPRSGCSVLSATSSP